MSTPAVTTDRAVADLERASSDSTSSSVAAAAAAAAGAAAAAPLGVVKSSDSTSSSSSRHKRRVGGTDAEAAAEVRASPIRGNDDRDPGAVGGSGSDGFVVNKSGESLPEFLAQLRGSRVKQPWWHWRKLLTLGNAAVLAFGLACAVLMILLSQLAWQFEDLGWQAWFTMSVIVLAFMALLKDLTPDVVMMAASALLVLARVIDVAEFEQGWSNSGPLTVGVMYMVARGLQESRVLELFVKYCLGRPRNYFWALFKMTAMQAFLSAWWNNTPQVACMIPVLETWSRRINISPSKLMIPLSYAVIIGNCSLIATSSNLVATGLAYAKGLPTLNFVEMGAVGWPVSLIVCTYVTFASYWLLPDTKSVVQSYVANPREYTVNSLVLPSSPIVGKSVQDAGLRALDGLFLVEIQRESGECFPAPSHDVMIQANDTLSFAGIVDCVQTLYRTIDGLVPAAAPQIDKLRIGAPEHLLVEAVIAPQSPLAGHSVKGCRFRTHFNAAIIAVHRQGHRVVERAGDIVLQPGDTLLMEADRTFVDDWRNNAAFSLVSEINAGGIGVGRLPYVKMGIALIMLLGLIVVAANNKVDVFTLAVWVAIIYIACRIVTLRQAYEAISLRVVTMIAASLGLSVALQNTGAAQAIAQTFISVLHPLGQMGIIAGVYISTCTMTLVINPTPAVSLVFPVAYNLHLANALTYKQMMYTIMFAASDEFSTPYGYQTNLMVMGPGGYGFIHYILMGVPMQFLVGTSVITLVYFIFRA